MGTKLLLIPTRYSRRGASSLLIVLGALLSMAWIIVIDPANALRLYAFGTFSSENREWYPSEYVRAVLPMYAIAVEHFNSRSGQVIPSLPQRLLKCPSTKIDLVKYMDDGDSEAVAMDELVKILIRQGQHGELIDGILGMYRNRLSRILGSATSALNIPMISYGAGSNTLSRDDTFRHFMRTLPTDEAVAIAMSDLFVKFNYKRVALIYTDDTYGNAFKNALFKISERNRHMHLVTVFIEEDQDSADDAVKFIKAEGLNVIVYVTFNLQNVGRLAVAAEKFDMLAPNKLWISTIPLFRIVRDGNPGSEDVLMRFFQGSIHIVPTIQGISNLEGIVENIQNDFWPALLAAIRTMNHSIFDQYIPDKLINGTRFTLPDNFYTNPEAIQTPYMAWAYDSVLAYGLAACECASQGLSDGCSVDPNKTNGPLLYEKLTELNFFGVSGHVAFLDNGDRDPRTCAYVLRNAQIVNTTDHKTGKSERTLHNADAGLWYPRSAPSAEDLVKLSQAGYWQLTNIIRYGSSGSTTPPPDIDIPYHDALTLPVWAMTMGLIESSIVTLGALWTFLFICANMTNKVVVKSQPHFLLLISFGCLLMGFSIIALTMETDLSCMAFPWLFLVGLTIALSAIAAKAWRVHRLWNDPRPQAKKVKKGKYYMIIIAFLVVVEMIVLIAWTCIAPLQYVREVVVKSEDGYPLVSHGTCMGASSDAVIFAGILIGINALVMIGTVYSSYLVRNAPGDFQESSSTLIAGSALLAVYFFGIPTMIALYSNTIGRFLSLSSIAFLTAIGLLLATYVPRVHAVRKLYRAEAQSRQSSSYGNNATPSGDGGNTHSGNGAPVTTTNAATSTASPRAGPISALQVPKSKTLIANLIPQYTLPSGNGGGDVDVNGNDKGARNPRSYAQATREPTEDYESVFVIPEGEEPTEEHEDEAKPKNHVGQRTSSKRRFGVVKSSLGSDALTEV